MVKLTQWAAALLSAALLAHAASRSPGRPRFYAGHDLSSLKILEDGGVVYRDAARRNVRRPAEDILGEGGMNTVRLRLWVNPQVPYGGNPGYYETYNLDYVTTLAQRFHAKGYHIFLDFHFSDYWGDPQQQWQPTAWPATLAPLAYTLRQYVGHTLLHLHRSGVNLAIVSLGNEIRHGMLWPLGRVSVDIEPRSARVAHFSPLASFYSAARHGVNDAVARGVPKPQVMIHLDNGWNMTMQERWFDAILATGKVKEADWDVFGFSFYPFLGTEATLSNLKRTLTWVARKYGKPIHIVETNWPAVCTGRRAPALSEPSIPASVAGQVRWVRKLVHLVKGLPQGLGQGVNYWEPGWVNNTALGSRCQDMILFDVDWRNYPRVTAYSRKSVKMFRGV